MLFVNFLIKVTRSKQTDKKKNALALLGALCYNNGLYASKVYDYLLECQTKEDMVVVIDEWLFYDFELAKLAVNQSFSANSLK